MSQTARGVGSRILVAASAIAAIALLPAPAFAETTATTAVPAARVKDLSQIQQRGEAAIDKRLTTIDQLQSKIGDAKHLTSIDKDTLTSLLATDKSGLTDLRAKIAADTDVATLRTDVKGIVDNYRIYVLVAPKVRLTKAADGITAVVVKENDLATKLDSQVGKLKAAAKDTSAAEAQIAIARTKSAAASSSIDGQVTTLLGLKATDYPNNQAARDGVKVAIKDGKADAKDAAQALKSARAALKSADKK